MYHFKGTGAVTWCENPPPNQCIKPSEYDAVMKKVKADCAYKKVSGQIRGLYGVRGLGVMCSQYAFRSDVMLSNLDQYDPCYVETLKPCLVVDDPVIPIVPPTRAGDPPATPEEPKEDDNTMYMVGGILAVLVVGGVGYAVFKSRKKKGGKRK